ncbi:MAG: biopolymer transporter ExbD [Methylophilaceae bacterium]|nr:biopolymer transporter ExbD [Methylophilaceae bacterium]
MNDYGSDGMMSEINVTPLVDVMLVLLTVFIVTAPLLMNAVSVNLPKASASIALQKISDVRVSITASGEVFVDKTKIPAASLENTLKQLKAKADVRVEILADERVPYREVARAMAQIQRAGISKFTFVMLPDSAMQAKS